MSTRPISFARAKDRQVFQLCHIRQWLPNREHVHQFPELQLWLGSCLGFETERTKNAYSRRVLPETQQPP